jgi:hypothetical protein
MPSKGTSRPASMTFAMNGGRLDGAGLFEWPTEATAAFSFDTASIAAPSSVRRPRSRAGYLPSGSSRRRDRDADGSERSRKNRARSGPSPGLDRVRDHLAVGTKRVPSIFRKCEKVLDTIFEGSRARSIARVWLTPSRARRPSLLAIGFEIIRISIASTIASVVES